jgi:hypothetical protein
MTVIDTDYSNRWCGRRRSRHTGVVRIMLPSSRSTTMAWF